MNNPICSKMLPFSNGLDLKNICAIVFKFLVMPIDSIDVRATLEIKSMGWHSPSNFEEWSHKKWRIYFETDWIIHFRYSTHFICKILFLSIYPDLIRENIIAMGWKKAYSIGFGFWSNMGAGLQVPVGVREVLVKVGWSNSGGTSAEECLDWSW